MSEADSPSDLRPGTELGRVRIQGRLGAGGMGEVYRATHLELGTEVAVKVLRPEVAENARLLKRFQAEAATTAALVHDNVVRVHELGTDRGIPYLVMELLAGRTLEDWLVEQPTPNVPGSLAILRQVLRGLSAAHRAGVIHRDIKPSNIFLCDSADGELLVKLLDFGIAKQAEGGALEHLTATGEILGTPAFMSPEQAAGHAIDGRSDLYALACVAYLMLIGRVPFTGPPLMMMMAHGQEQPKPPSQVGDDPRLAVVDPWILKALAKSPDDRFPSAEAMLAALEGVIAALPRPARKPSPSRARLVGALIAGGALVAVGTAILLR